MRKFFTIIAFLIVYWTVNGQEKVPVIQLNELRFNAETKYNSNAITNELLSSYINGDFINNDLKDKSKNRLTEMNSLGLFSELSADMVFSTKKENQVHHKLLYSFGFKTKSYTEINFREDFYSIYFYGNKQYAGQSIEMKQMGFYSITFHQIRFGIEKAFEKYGMKHKAWITMGFNFGQNYFRADVNNGSFYIHPQGEELKLTLNMDLARTDTSDLSLMNFTGYGASLNLVYDLEINEKNKIRLSAGDLGFIAWNKKSFKFNRDSIYSYTGWQVENIFDTENEIFERFSTDTLTNEYALDKKKTSFLSTTPLDLQLCYKNQITGKISATATIRKFVFTRYKPLYRIKLGYKIHKNWEICPMAGYGGLGAFNAGLEINADLPFDIKMKAGTDFINSYLIPDKFSGQGGYIMVLKSF